ncbi:hypothetical protein [Gordonia sp. N1V]|uniref:hypothetical protein n=1 Tax=Gordonia sp. N1V TaxID=3034163 RepID=UPI0023E256AF|nr:hypothetical protein [Gordonia sp. N1V]MDF3285121.1 hypothetical protein [Gordonia sp. N1V]
MRRFRESSALSAFQMSDAPLDTAGALRALAAGGTLLILGVVLGDWARVGVAYLGAACSVAFVLGNSYRVRFTVLVAASAGAAVGIVVGGSTTGHGALPIIVVAVAAAAVSGLIGVLGPGGPAFGCSVSGSPTASSVVRVWPRCIRRSGIWSAHWWSAWPTSPSGRSGPASDDDLRSPRRPIHSRARFGTMRYG